VRLVSLQIEGLTTISTTGAGVHRIEQCQLEGGLTIGAISATIYVVGCTLGNLTVSAGFTGLLLLDRCLFNPGSTITNNTLPTRLLISDSAGLAAAPVSSAILNGRFQNAAGSTTYYADGAALLKAPLTSINGLTPAADRIAYYTGASSGALATLTAFARTLLDDADAATARTTLGLGTAATVNTGTGSGNVPVLDGSGRLPAVDGSLLTNLPGSSPYAADVWDYEWSAASGTTMEADGWTKTGTLADTSSTIGAYTARLLTPTANSGAAYMSKTIVTGVGGLAPVTGMSIAGSFELRVLCQLPASTSANIVHAFAFCMAAGGNQFIPAVTSTGLWASSGAGSLTSLVLTGGLPNRSLWLTIRCANGVSSGTTAATSYTEVWAGPVRIWTGLSSTPWASFTAGNEGLLRIGRIVGPGSGGNVDAVAVSSIRWRAGWNQAPVDYTMRALRGSVGP